MTLASPKRPRAVVREGRCKVAVGAGAAAMESRIGEWLD